MLGIWLVGRLILFMLERRFRQGFAPPGSYGYTGVKSTLCLHRHSNLQGVKGPVKGPDVVECHVTRLEVVEPVTGPEAEVGPVTGPEVVECPVTGVEVVEDFITGSQVVEPVTGPK